MRVNTYSWHYKFMQKLQIKHSDNVCQYIRRFLLACMQATFFIFIGLIVLMMMLSPLHVIFFGGDYGNPIVHIALLVYFIIALVIINDWRKEAMGNKKVATNPFVQYVSDKHNKICTNIEYE